MWKKWWRIGLLLFFITGCSGTLETSPDLAGYVMAQEDDRILVVNPELDEYDQFPAYWTGDVPNDVEIGQKVEVWFDTAVATSYPGQVGNSKIKVVPIEPPEGADLTEYQALQTALGQRERQMFGFYVLDSISYDKSRDEWKVRLFQTYKSKTETIVVKD